MKTFQIIETVNFNEVTSVEADFLYIQPCGSVSLHILRHQSERGDAKSDIVAVIPSNFIVLG